MFLRYILEIENNVKTALAYEFSKKYGFDNYLTIGNFNTNVQPHEKRKTAAQKIGEVSDLITGIQREISKQLSNNNPMISHYMLEEGYVPLWVLVNILTLRTISKFYNNLKQINQNTIGIKFKLYPDEMCALLSVLSIFRNQCVHDSRIYNFKAVKKNGAANSIKTNKMHAELKIQMDSGNNPIYGKNDLFAIVIIFKLMLSKSSFNKFCFALKHEIEEVDKKLQTIEIETILQKMGFPSN